MRLGFCMLFLILLDVACYGQYGVYCHPFQSDTSGFIWSGDFVKKKKQGEWIGNSVTSKYRITATYEKNLLHGKWEVTYSQGKIKETGQYKSNLSDGVWVKYYPNGDTFHVCTYVKGILNGPYREYHPGNRKACTGNFVNGLKQGKWEDFFGYSMYSGPNKTTTYRYRNDTLHGYTIVIDGSESTSYLYDNGQIKSIVKSSFSQGDGVVHEGPDYSSKEIMQEQAAVITGPCPIVSPDLRAEFPGGENGLNTYLTDSLRFPKQELLQNIAGRVHIQFSVNSDGTVANVYAVNTDGTPDVFVTEAIRLVAAMPPWTPAIFMDERVGSSQYVIVYFRIP